MKKFIFIKFIASLCLVFATSLTCWAQTSLKDFTVIYDKPYQIEDIYSIRYNNLEQPSKLNAFKIEFYAPDNSKLSETTETFPLSSTNEIYSLSDSVVGFNSIKVSVISLHEGLISNFPSNLNSILALTQDNVIPEPPEPPSNTPPTVQNYNTEIDASTDTTNLNISSYYSDSDGDVVTVIPKSLNGDQFSYSLESNGNLIIKAPSITGTYNFPYEIKDSKGAKASAEVTINVNIPETLKTAIDEQVQSITQIISDLKNREIQIRALGPIPDETMLKLEALLAKNKALSATLTESKYSGIKADIDALTHELEEKQEVMPHLILENVETTASQSLALKTQLQALNDMSAQAGVDITAFTLTLNTLKNDVAALKTQEDAILEAKLINLSQLEAWETSHQTLKDKLDPSIFSWANILIALIGLTLFLAALYFIKIRSPKFRKKQKEDNKENHAVLPFNVYSIRQTPDGFTTEILENYDSNKSSSDTVEPSGFIFPENPSFQTLDKDIKTAMPDLWQAAYKATGRVGMAQMGVPIGKDDCLGTCILINPNYIITNRHVFETHYDRIMEPEELIGVEFFGELESAETEFHKISNQEVYILEERDAVILKLETTVDQNHRPYIKFSNKPPETYVDDDIIVIGYPVQPNLDDLTDAQLQVFEDIEIYSVKRFSTGHVFSHQYDTDGDFIVETKTSGEYSPDERQPAISYDASTLPGNSGSPVVSKNTGDVIGLHFGDGRFDQQPANVGHSGQILAGFVTYVTSGQALNMINKVS